MRELRHARASIALPCDVAAAQLAARQRAMIATKQLIALGLDKDGIRRRVRSARLHPYHRGVYSLVPKQALPPLAAEQAALLAMGPGAVLSHRTAAAIWELAPRDPATVDVIVPRQRRHRPGIRVHRAAGLQAADVRTRERLTLTSPYRSILDLRTELSARQIAYAVSQALSRRLITDAEASTLTDAPTITRSEAERRFLDLVKRAGFPRPRTNVHVAGFEVDFFWPDHDLVVEIDGFAFHGHRQAFEDDRRKSLALERAGIRTIRLSWRQLVDDAVLVVASLARLLCAR